MEEPLPDWAPWAGVCRVLLLSVEEEQISLRLTGRLPEQQLRIVVIVLVALAATMMLVFGG